MTPASTFIKSLASSKKDFRKPPNTFCLWSSKAFSSSPVTYPLSDASSGNGRLPSFFSFQTFIGRDIWLIMYWKDWATFSRSFMMFSSVFSPFIRMR